MKFIKSRKGVVSLVATLVVAGAAALGAYAFLTVGGSGSGSATAGTTTDNLVIGTGTDAADPVTVAGGILPGAANAVGVTYYIHNPNTFGVQVASVSASSITQSDTTCNTAPLNADFSYTDAAANGYPVTVAAGATAGPFTGTLTESDDASNNQDSCLSPNSTTLTLVSN